MKSLKKCKDIQISNFRESISEVGCYIGGVQGLSIVLPTHTGGNQFLIVLGRGAYIGALPLLFPVPQRHIVRATSFLSLGNKKG